MNDEVMIKDNLLIVRNDKYEVRFQVSRVNRKWKYTPPHLTIFVINKGNKRFMKLKVPFRYVYNQFFSKVYESAQKSRR